MSVEIRAWVPEDVPEVSGWMGTPDVRRALGISEDADEQQIEMAMWLALSDPMQRWLIAIDDDERIGVIGLTSINPHDRSAVLNMVMSPDHQGRGGFVAKKTRKILKSWNLAKIITLISPENKRAIKVAEGFGFEFPDMKLGVLNLLEE